MLFGATGNTLTGNVVLDAWDTNGPGFNTWLNNVFGTTDDTAERKADR